ncbi:AAA family ATPase [Pseudomonas sp. SDO5271_S396]
MLDERDIHANLLLKELNKLRLRFTQLQSHQFYRLVLYVLALTSNAIHPTTLLRARAELDLPGLGAHLSERVDALMFASDFEGRETDEIVSALNSRTFTLLADRIVQRTADKSADDIVHMFDFIFLRAVQLAYEIDSRHPPIVAALANGLLSHGQGLIDAFPYSGEPFVVEHRRNTKAEHFHLQAVFGYDDLVNLRLRLRGLTSRPVYTPDLAPVIGLTVIDAVSSRSQTQGDTFQTLSHLIDDNGLSRRTLVIVKNADKVPKALISRIKRLDLLEAVIDLTSFDAQEHPTRISAWLLNTEKPYVERTLCLDVSALANLPDQVDALSAAWFAAAVVDLWSGRYQFRLGRYPEVKAGPLKGLFTQMFDRGYVDTPGVCEQLPSSDVLRQKLTATTLLQKPPTPPNWSLLDQRPLLHLLLNSAVPFCAYVIGNNGVGKSLLLASLINILDDRKIPSAGLAFGLSDRFPLRKKASEESLFAYLGNRTASTGHSYQQASSVLTRQLIQVYTSPSRLALFSLALDHLDFKHQQYLVPVDASDRQLSHGAEALNIWPLSPISKDNRPLREETKKRVYELALIRREGNDLVRFSLLSSGEQQIIMLFSKIAAHAKPGMVFLIDEPEISLHVQWQQALPGLLSEIARQAACSFVIATHSPTLVANAQAPDTHCFLARDQALTSIPLEHRHSVETILLEGFKVYTPHNREVHERCAALVSRAIQLTNQAARVDTVQRDEMTATLDEMAKTMTDSAKNKGRRFEQDLSLIEQAKRAIDETYALADLGGRA